MRNRENRNNTGVRILVLMVFAGLIAAMTSACHEYEMKSQWRDREIVVDGSTSDWARKGESG